MVVSESSLRSLIAFIVAGDDAAAWRALATSPALATARVSKGATRQSPEANFFEEIKHYVYEGDTALHLAAAAYRKAVVRKLVAAGADPNAVDKAGVTPLHRAVRNRCAAAVGALLEGGADPRRRNKSGSTARQLASLTTGRGGVGSPETGLR